VDVFAVRDRVVNQYADYVRSFFTIRESDTRRFVDDYLAAALAVVCTERSPLTDREITDLALERGLFRASGKTPPRHHVGLPLHRRPRPPRPRPGPPP
jgi:hypothetical protein